MSNYCITIARGFGSGGRTIAKRVADRLGINFYEHRILTLASQYSGYPEDFFQEEKLNGAYFTNVLAKLPISMTPQPVLSKFASDPKLFDIQSKIIRQLAENENCVIVGKCADYILRDRENVFSFYVEAPREFCLPRIMKKLNVSESEAHNLISKTDKYRAEYYKYYTGGKDWTDVLNYDMTINTGKTGEDMAVEMIIDYVEKKLKENMEK